MMREASTNRIGSALGAIFKKNLLEFIRYPANLAFSLVMPIIWFLPVYFLVVSFAPGGESVGLSAWIGQSNFFTYLPVGLVVGYVIMTIFWNVGFAFKRLMDIGMLETIWALPVPRMIHMVGESLFSMARMVIELGIVIATYRLLYGFVVPLSILRSLPYFIDYLRVETLGIVPLVSPSIERIVFIAGAIILPLLGMLFFKWVERRTRVLGNLHVH